LAVRADLDAVVCDDANGPRQSARTPPNRSSIGPLVGARREERHHAGLSLAPREGFHPGRRAGMPSPEGEITVLRTPLERLMLASQGLRALAVSAMSLGANQICLLALVAAGADHLGAQAVAILLVTPFSFVANKLWAFTVGARPAELAVNSAKT